MKSYLLRLMRPLVTDYADYHPKEHHLNITSTFNLSWLVSMKHLNTCMR